MLSVHSCWCGPEPLGRLQQLTVASFLGHGHRFVLWTYTRELIVLPGVELRDAAEILPRKFIYRLDGTEHPGSLAFFSDLFQLTLLEQCGGWWVQMDVTCLRPLDELDRLSYVFAPHWKTGVAAYVMKAPPRSQTIMGMRSRHAACIRQDTQDWHASMEIMGSEVRTSGLARFIQPRSVLPNDVFDHSYYTCRGVRPPTSCVVHHWCDSISRPYDRSVQNGSFYHDLLVQYGLW
jgi:hypothetical protein